MENDLNIFKEEVVLKYQLYNSLFLTLPFPDLYDIGVNLPLFNSFCQSKLAEKISPKAIIDGFFKEYLHQSSLAYKLRVVKVFSQLIERQVALFDAIDDAAFSKTHHLSDYGSIEHLISEAKKANRLKKLSEILQTYRIKMVLTAHPTQFYPPQVLSIIKDLSIAIENNAHEEVRNILLQLGKTSFSNQQQPTPLDEARILITQLNENFYPVIRDSYFNLYQALGKETKDLYHNIQIGFWPGGDRDGNPNVTVETTREVAKLLKTNILRLYIHEIRNLRRRLTFPGIWQKLNNIETKLQNSFNQLGKNTYQTAEQLLTDVKTIKAEVVKNHQGLFANLIDKFIAAITCFGFYFASIDLRQNSKMHHENLLVLFNALLKQKIAKNVKAAITNYLTNPYAADLIELIHSNLPKVDSKKFSNYPILQDILQSLQCIRGIQTQNGEAGLSRYIISNTTAVENLLELILLAKLAGLNPKKLHFDIVPLFESITDLQQAESIMRQLFENPLYKTQLKNRQHQQTIMLGFSDGTKDGGYLSANFEILNAKMRLYQLGQQYNIAITFFDGRGGPSARGGGNTHKFYQALASDLEKSNIELTIQGQTVTSKFGNQAKAKFNLEQLFTAGLYPKISDQPPKPMPSSEFNLLSEMAKISLRSYLNLKNHPLFVDYLENATTLNFYGKLNIASRPARRKTNSSFEDLRAIPFVSAWTQMKQNIPGFYGLGSALQELKQKKLFQSAKNLYQQNLFFKTLIDNAMQSLSKTNFDLTEYLSHDKKYQKFWQLLFKEYNLSKQLLLELTDHQALLEQDSMTQQSIALRENLIFPLSVIQQAALMNLRQLGEKKASSEAYIFYQNVILKTLAAIINASRNAV